MYSTSLGNSAMTSTSCSSGRQKLRFQISLKVRTARDRGGSKEVPRGGGDPGRAPDEVYPLQGTGWHRGSCDGVTQPPWGTGM